MKTLSVIIPVYFNAESLPRLFSEIEAVGHKLRAEEIVLELIFVDDGSGDDSLNVLLQIKKAHPEIKVIKLSRNFGVMRAIKAGFKYASGDCITVLSADLQDPPELILQMVAQWKKGSKFIICTRASREDPLLTRLFSKIYYKLLHWFVMPDFPKGGYDIAMIDKSLLPYIINSSKNYYLPLLAYWLGFKPDVIPYHRAKREHGKSRWTFRKKFNAFLDIMLGFSVTPIRLISMIGAIVSLCSFTYGMVVIYYALFHSMPVQGFATIVALISFLLGLVIIMLGIIGEYLWRIFDETNKRPDVVIDEVY